MGRLGASLWGAFSQHPEHMGPVSLLYYRARVRGLPSASDAGRLRLELAGSEGFQGIDQHTQRLRRYPRKDGMWCWYLSSQDGANATMASS